MEKWALRNDTHRGLESIIILAKQHCFHLNTFQLLAITNKQKVLVKLVLLQFKHCVVSLALVLTSRGNTLRLPCDRDRGYGICESGEEGKGLQPHRLSSDYVYHSESQKSALASCLQSVNLSMAEGVNKTIRVLLLHSHANKKSNHSIVHGCWWWSWEGLRGAVGNMHSGIKEFYLPIHL